ncbi:hypothetical protein vseg_017561 [Gypsophila vaccaria]
MSYLFLKRCIGLVAQHLKFNSTESYTVCGKLDCRSHGSSAIPRTTLPNVKYVEIYDLVPLKKGTLLTGRDANI